MKLQAQAQIYEPYEGKPFYSCFSGPVHPRSRGTVTLQSDDPYDPPLIDPNYFDDPRDIDDLVEGKIGDAYCSNLKFTDNNYSIHITIIIIIIT